MGVIYIATNLTNGKQYVGQTILKLTDRIGQHQRVKKKTYFENALSKHGLKNFKILKFDCPFDLLNEYESFWINELKTKAPNGYNLTDGGDGCKGYKQTEEHKKKIGKKSEERFKDKTNHPHYGKPRSEETKEKIALSKIGKPRSEETKKKIKENHADMSGENNPMWGKKRPDVTERNKLRGLKNVT